MAELTNVSSSKPSFAVVGCGKVGISLAYFLVRAGYPAAGFTSRSLTSAQKAAQIAGGVCSQYFWEITRKADIVFITTPDSVIADVCAEIADKQGFTPNSTVFHCSGAIQSTILSSARDCGACIASWHPLQSFASIRIEQNPFQGIIAAIEGDVPAVTLGRTIAEDLEANPLNILTDGKVLYHAAAVAASNYLVTLFDFCFKLAAKAGMSEAEAYKVMKPLVMGTLANIERVGVREALTGPIVRGDSAIVEQHLADIGAQVPELLPLYRMLGQFTVDIAEYRGTPSAAIDRLRKLLA